MRADETRRALPADRAFVLQLRPGALPDEGRMTGRVEHVATGRSRHFGSLAELLAFLGEVLKTLPEEGAETRPRPHRKAR